MGGQDYLSPHSRIPAFPHSGGQDYLSPHSHPALVFKSSIEDPARFERGEDAGAFAGLAPRRSQSGERDHKGRISKAGDPMLRAALYEAANSLLSRVKRPCALRTWGLRLAETKGAKRARVAVARKLAILLHRLWQSETEFRWA